MKYKNIFITGGAGFIGSHLVDRLTSLKDINIRVYDNLSNNVELIKPIKGKTSFELIEGDLLSLQDVVKAVKGCEVVYHLAANPEVRISVTDPEVHFKQNVLATYNLLEALRKDGCAKLFVFTSSSTVYGDAEKIPTPEDYAPLKPISVYGASKLACESLISAYAYTYGFKAIIYRLANIVGPRSKHGVIYDFIMKLRENPHELVILGDGNQTKSYLYIDDCIDAILLGVERSSQRVELFNVGSEDQVDVKTIAKIVVEEMELKDVKFKFTGGINGGRGWKGDVKNMLLDITKLKSLGWKPRYNSIQAVKLATRSLIKELKIK